MDPTCATDGTPTSLPDGRSLRALTLEQVMRCTDDETLAWLFRGTEPQSRAAHVALGRLLSNLPLRLVAGCPIVTYLTGAELDPHWRDAYPCSATSLWGSLEFLRTMVGPAGGPDGPLADPLDELEALRARWDQELGGT